MKTKIEVQWATASGDLIFFAGSVRSAGAASSLPASLGPPRSAQRTCGLDAAPSGAPVLLPAIEKMGWENGRRPTRSQGAIGAVPMQQRGQQRSSDPSAQRAAPGRCRGCVARSALCCEVDTIPKPGGLVATM
jgi:hypothetical protein